VHVLAMEYIPGQTLHRLVVEGGPLPPGRAAHLFAQVAAGLYHAHKRGLVHRDIKPSNVMVTPDGVAKLLDFGLALCRGEPLPDDRTIAGGQGYVVGTMDYLAPEQADDPTGVDHRSDLYSLGCALYFALSGRPPFPGGTSLEKIQRHRNETPPPLAEVNPTVPRRLARFVEELMARSPDARPSSAKVVKRMLLLFAEAEEAARTTMPELVVAAPAVEPPTVGEDVPVLEVLPAPEPKPPAPPAAAAKAGWRDYLAKVWPRPGGDR
jgi:serine/threonine protein kinase